MGYTHYYNQRPIDAETWDEVTRDVKLIIAEAERGRIRIGDGMGKRGSKPTFTPLRIQFNGIGENSHEDFMIDRNGCDGYCKTDRKPYDVVVTAVLCYLSCVHNVAFVTSDGYGTDFLAGWALAKKALPDRANKLDVPMGVMQSDVWCPPWVSSSPDGYRVGCSVDGRAYIIRERDDASYSWSSHREAAAWIVEQREPGKHPDANRTGTGLFNATGSFDRARHDNIAKAQKKILDAKIKEGAGDPSRQLKPPAFVRLWEMDLPERRAYYFRDLLVEPEPAIVSEPAPSAVPANDDYDLDDPAARAIF